MLDSVVRRNTLISNIEKARNSVVIAYMLHDNAVIADDALPQIYDKLQATGHRERIDLLLLARNGIPEVCWQLLNLAREFCDHLGVIVGTRTQGAGSLLTLGADEIVMGPISQVGGVEALRKHPLLPRDEFGQPIPISFTEIKGLLDFLGISTTGEAGQQSTSSTQNSDQPLSALFAQLHPLVLANMLQADTLTRDLTRKALNMHMHPDDAGATERLVALFNGGFHSPQYMAARSELLEAGLAVTAPDEELWSNIWELVQLYQTLLYTDRPDPTAPGAFFRYVCLVESTGRSTGLRQTFTQVEGQERVLQIRWETAVRGPGPGPSFGPGGVSNN